MLCNKHLFCSAGFEEREIRLSARTGEFTRVSGACNGEFGGAAVSRNQVMIVRENLSAEATKNPTETSGFFGEEREVSCCFATNISSAPRVLEKERFAFQRERTSLLALVERATESSAA